MTQKFALTLAAAITAFVLVVGGAIAGRAMQPATTNLSTSPTTTDAQITDLQQVYAQREAEYQRRLDEANQTLSDLYAQQAVSSSPAQGQSTDAASTAGSAAPQVKLTPRGAMSAAVLAAPGATVLRTPELVDFRGTVAYEVKLDVGLIYVDANSGAVLYNSALSAQTLATSHSEGGDHEEFENEHEGHD